MSAKRTSERNEAEASNTPSSVLLWLIPYAALAVLVARRLGAFSLWATIRLADGETRRLPNALGLVDHPFHAVRAETLRRALAHGHMLDWISHHQGGYPVEFYPLGVAGLDVAVWGLALGSLPMVLIHKLVVIGIFLAPLIGYALITGFDRRSLGVGLIAGAAHLAVRGWWWSGGAMELYEWGLVTNVAAVTALLIALPLTGRYFAIGARRSGAFAAVLSAFALVTNPRSGIALASLIVGAVLAVLIAGDIQRPSWALLARRCALLILVTALLAAPELLSLARFSHLYYFVHYSDYADLRAYRQSSIQAVGGPAFVLGIVGFLLAVLPKARLIHRAVAISLAIYVGGTAMLVTGAGPSRLIAQLELPRLMPFQRFLWFALAALAVEAIVLLLLRIVKLRSTAIVADAVFVVVAAAVMVLYVIRPPGFIPAGDRGLVQMPTAATAGIADLEDAVKVADTDAADGTAMLVLGTTLSWHDQLWAPLWSDRPMFYDDWLWYWQTKNYGAYNPKTEHAFPDDASALTQDYLQHHGIGAIVVTGQAKPVAKTEPYLTLQRSGVWDVYTVNAPTSVITISGNAPHAVALGEQSYSATGTANGGEIVIRRNWFPRWKATIDGRSVPIAQSDDGYMQIAAPASGEIQLQLTYSLDWLDWLARIATALGFVLTLILLLPRRTTLRLRPGSTRSVPRAIPRVRPERR